MSKVARSTFVPATQSRVAVNTPASDVPLPLVDGDGFAPASSIVRPSLTADAPAAVDEAGLPRKVLHRGAHSPAVEQLQAALVKVGLLTKAQVATGPGFFGPRTELALKALQEKAGISPASGVFDRETRQALAQAVQSGKHFDHIDYQTGGSAPSGSAGGASGSSSVDGSVAPGGGSGKVTQVALEWLKHPPYNPNNNSHDWNGYCQGFARRVYEAAGGTGIPADPSAKLAAYDLRAQGKLHGDPAHAADNSILYWTSGKSGHAAVMTDLTDKQGRRLVVTTTGWGGNSGIKLMPYEELCRLMGGSPAGWAAP
ncbi:MAG: peptidoglycan-binding protein [Myxococcaceae bacterium]|nr:peptidoglycan-binding protein [Myxococcaceae bacterium]